MEDSDAVVERRPLVPNVLSSNPMMSGKSFTFIFQTFDVSFYRIGWKEEGRKKAVDAKLTNDITVEGDNIKIFTDAGFDSRTENFKLGEPYEVENHLQEKGLVILIEYNLII